MKVGMRGEGEGRGILLKRKNVKGGYQRGRGVGDIDGYRHASS